MTNAVKPAGFTLKQIASEILNQTYSNNLNFVIILTRLVNVTVHINHGLNSFCIIALSSSAVMMGEEMNR